MSKRDRERHKAKVVSAQERAGEGGSSFERTAVKLPPGVERPFFKVPVEDKTFSWEIIPFPASKTHPAVVKGTCKKGSLVHERTYHIHYGVGPSGKGAYICNERTFGEKCPICDFAREQQGKPDHAAKMDKLNKAFDKNYKEWFGRLWPKQRQLFNVYDNDNQSKGVQIFDVSYHNFGKYLYDKINMARTPKQKKWQYFATPDKTGRTLIVGGKKTTNEGTPRPFMEYSSIDFEKRSEPIPDTVLESAVCLDDCLVKTPYEVLRDIFMGKAKKDEVEFEKGDEVEFKVGKKTICGKVTKVDEDEEELTVKDEKGKKHTVAFDKATKAEADEDDDDDEDEKPAKKGAKKKAGKKSKYDDDDDEDEDDDEDDDEDEDDDDDDEDDDEDEDDDDDDEDEDDDDDDEDEDDDDDEKPVKKKGKKPAPKKKGKK